MKNFNGGFPAEFYFYDIKDEKLKKMTVTEKAWEDTFKTFEDNNKVSHNVIQKYMSKHEDVTLKEA